MGAAISKRLLLFLLLMHSAVLTACWSSASSASGDDEPSTGADSDTDADGDTLSAVVVSNPTNGALSLSADGSFTYDPGPNWYGTDSFEYCATDGSFSSLDMTVTITVNAVNDAPTAGDEKIGRASCRERV